MTMKTFPGYGVWSMGLLETHALLVITFRENKPVKEEAKRIVEWFKMAHFK